MSLETILRMRTGISETIIDGFLYSSENFKIDLDDKLEKRIDGYVSVLLFETKKFFDRYTEDDCAVTIKLIDQTAIDTGPSSIKIEDLPVYTYARDPESSARRGTVPNYDKPYKCDDHSPFLELLKSSHHKTYFISNDLIFEESRKRYLNNSPHWKNFYNATCIVPIKNPNATSNDEFLGFFCIDNFKGKFDETTCSLYLQIVASTLYYVFTSRSALEFAAIMHDNDAVLKVGKSVENYEERPERKLDD